MATLGIVSNSLLRIYGEYSYTQNITTNQTTLYTSVKVQIYGGGSGNETFRGRTQIGGSFYSGNNQSINLGVAATHTLMSRSDVITHNSDGTFPSDFGLQFSCFSAESWMYSTHINLNSVIPTIPRTSGISNNTSSGSRKDIGTSVSFSIDRKNSSFLHYVYYKIGSTNYQIGNNVATNIDFTFPLSLVEQFPTTATPNITVVCDTYNGATYIGSSSTTVFLNVPTSYIPTCSLAIEDLNSITGAWGIWVKSKSVLKGTITANGIADSTIKSYLSTVEGQPLINNPFTRELTTSGSLTITSKVYDTRDRINTDSKNITVLDYHVPTIVSAKVERCLEDGTLDDFGTYGKVICQYDISSLENKNDKKLVVNLGELTLQVDLDSYADTFVADETQLFGILETNVTYSFTFELVDSFATTPQYVTVTPSYVLMGKRAGGKGLTLGRVATEDGFHVYMDSSFRERVDLYDNVYIYDEDGEELIPIFVDE